MAVLKSKLQKWLAILGILFILSYLFDDVLYNKMWLLSFLVMILLAAALVIVFAVAVIKGDQKAFQIVIGVLIIVAISEAWKSETFKSEKVLQATLYDELSFINLTLRRNNTFELSAATMFSNKDFTGKYKLVHDKIIFLDKPYDNDFIPDTLTIIGDKIILRFDRHNKPISDFATYFDVSQNNIQNSH